MLTAMVLVYLAGVAEGISVAAIILVTVGVVIAGLSGTKAAIDQDTPFNEREKTAFDRWKKFWAPKFKWALVGVAIAVLMPSKQLLYVAAGLQVGQEVVQTELAQKTIRLLSKTIDELIGDAVPESR